MQRLSRDPIHHLDTKGESELFVVRFFGEQAKSLFNKGIETFFRREIRLIAGYSRPKQGRRVGGVVAWLALHKCEL